MENQTIHGNPSCDISDPDSCSGGHSVSKEDRKTEPVSQIIQIDESDDGEEEDGPHISLNANTSEELGQNKTRGNVCQVTRSETLLADDRTPAVEQLLPILPMGIS